MPADDNFRWLDSDEESLLFDNEKLIGRIVKENKPSYVCYSVPALTAAAERYGYGITLELAIEVGRSAPMRTEHLVYWCSDPDVAKFELMRRIRAQRHIPDQVRSEDANAG